MSHYCDIPIKDFHFMRLARFAPDKYEVKCGNKNKILRYLQRLCLRFLIKTGAAKDCNFTEDKMSVKTISVDIDKLTEIVCKQVVEVRRFYGNRPRLIVIGEDIGQRIFANHAQDISTPSVWTWSTHLNCGPKLMGIEVVYVPWFDGVVVVPE